MKFMSIWLFASLIIVIVAVVFFVMVGRGKPKD